jgi:hypothetical protein
MVAGAATTKTAHQNEARLAKWGEARTEMDRSEGCRRNRSERAGAAALRTQVHEPGHHGHSAQDCLGYPPFADDRIAAAAAGNRRRARSGERRNPIRGFGERAPHGTDEPLAGAALAFEGLAQKAGAGRIVAAVESASDAKRECLIRRDMLVVFPVREFRRTGIR